MDVGAALGKLVFAVGLDGDSVCVVVGATQDKLVNALDGDDKVCVEVGETAGQAD